MLTFRKGYGYNVKIVTIIVAVVFIFNSTGYGTNLSNKAYLRKPLDFNDTEKSAKYICVGLAVLYNNLVLRSGLSTQEAFKEIIDRTCLPNIQNRRIGVIEDAQGNLWIYHGSENIYIKLEDKGQFSPNSREEFLEMVQRKVAFVSEKTRAAYDAIALDYNTLRGDTPNQWDEERLHRLLDIARSKVREGTLGDAEGNIRLLDRGTGSGRDLKWFQGNTHDVHFLGIDNSQGFIDLLTQRVAQGDFPEGCVAQMDMTFLSGISDASYDVVRDNTSILHLVDLKGAVPELGADKAVSEAYRVLRPGGEYFIMVKAGEGLQEIDSGEGLGSRYFQLYNQDTLRDLLERNGFIVPTVEEWIDHRPSGDVKMLYVYAEKPSANVYREEDGREASMELKVFKGFEAFINLREAKDLFERLKGVCDIRESERFRHVIPLLLAEKESLKNPDEPHKISDPYYRYPSNCQPCSVHAKRILERFNFRAELRTIEFPEDIYPGLNIDRHTFVVTEIGGKEFIIDIAADQFEPLGENEWVDLGVVVLPIDVVNQDPARFWMYSGHKASTAEGQSVTEPLSDIAKSVTKAINRYKDREQNAQLLLDFIYTDIETGLKTQGFSLDEIAEMIERYFMLRIYGIPLPDLRNNGEPGVLDLAESGELFLFGVQVGKREADKVVLLQKDSIDVGTLKNNINSYFTTNLKRLVRLAERRYKEASEILMNPETRRDLANVLLLKILDDYRLKHRGNQKGNAVAMNAFSIIEDFIRDELRAPLYSDFTDDNFETRIVQEAGERSAVRISGVDIGYVEAVSAANASASGSNVIEYTEIDERIIGDILYNIGIYLRQKAGLPDVKPNLAMGGEYEPDNRDIISQVVTKVVKETDPEGLFGGDNPDAGQMIEIFEELGIRPGDAVLEIGPGISVISIIAACLGAKVTLVEHPDVATRERLESLIEYFRSDIENGGGDIEFIFGDITSSDIQEEIGRRGKFDHIIALDVLRPNPSISESDSVFFDFRHSKSLSPLLGIVDSEKVIAVINLIINAKSANRGSVYVSHPDSVEEGPRAIDDLEATIGMHPELHISYKKWLPIPRNKMPIGLIYRFGSTSEVQASIDPRTVLPGEHLAEASIASNVQDLSELKNTVVFFIGEEVKKNSLAFRSALDKLGETNFVVILAADSQERDMLNNLIFAELGIPLERFRVMSFGEASIDASRVNSYIMQIFGLEDMHCIPCTPIKLRLHPELKEAERKV